MFFGWLSSGQEVGTGMKKRALIISTVCGFLWQFERNDVRLLQENGYEIHYASNFGNPVYTYDKNAYDRMGIITHHIPIQKSPGCWKENRKALKVLTEIIKKENIQLIHCHTPMILCHTLWEVCWADWQEKEPEPAYMLYIQLMDSIFIRARPGKTGSFIFVQKNFWHG